MSTPSRPAITPGSKLPPLPPRAPRPPEHVLAEAIMRRAHELTVPALLDALQALGLRAEELEFRSHYSRGHQSFLVHAVEIELTERRAVVTLNIGLLAAQSPLPSYFFSVMEDGQHDTDALLVILSLIDHPLLRERARAEYPERDRRTWPDWEHDKGLVLSLMALHSPSSLHWLFQRLYPELAVQITRIVHGQSLVTEQVVLGATALGESQALGGQVRLATGAMAVTLYCEEPDSMTGRPWPKEAATRLENHILPLLREQNLFLDVWMVCFDRDTVARLAADQRAPDSFLGYDPLSKAPPSASAQTEGHGPRRPHDRVLLFRGHTARSN